LRNKAFGIHIFCVIISGKNILCTKLVFFRGKWHSATHRIFFYIALWGKSSRKMGASRVVCAKMSILVVKMLPYLTIIRNFADVYFDIFTHINKLTINYYETRNSICRCVRSGLFMLTASVIAGSSDDPRQGDQ
jgi:hypothetical protein